MGTTVPDRPGWRAESSVTACRLRQRRAHRVELLGQACLAHPQVEAGERIEVRLQCLGAGCDVGRELIEHPLFLGRGSELGLAPGIGQLDRDERFHEQRLAAAGLVMDDALDAAACFGPHGHHVASVAQRDDGLLEGAGKLRVEQCLEAAAQPLVGDAHGPPQPAQGRGGGVQDLPGWHRRWLPGGCAGQAAGRCCDRGREAGVGPARAGHPPGGRRR